MNDQKKLCAIYALREALIRILNNVDYMAKKCSQTDMVGAVLPSSEIINARKILQETKP